MKKQLYCDIDSTINNHWVRIQKWASPKFPGHSIHPNAFTRAEIMKDKPLPGARAALEKLSEKYDIHFLSARNFDDAQSITEDWLNMHGFKYKSVNITKNSKEKVSFLCSRKCDIFIDDLSAGQEKGPSYINLYHDTISLLKKEKIPFIIFKGNWFQVVQELD